MLSPSATRTRYNHQPPTNQKEQDMENIIGAVILTNIFGFAAMLVVSPFFCKTKTKTK
jgi:hypothetical protein